MDTMDIVVQLLMAFLGTMGFGMMFHVQWDRLLLCSLSGLLSWAVFLAMGLCFQQDAPRYFFASVAVTICAEVLARVVKCPATVFLVIGEVPLIPGGSLYRAMSSFMAQDYAAFSQQGFNTLIYAGAIAVGMLFPMSVFQLIRRTRELVEKEGEQLWARRR